MVAVNDHVDIFRTVSVPPGPEGPLDCVVTAVSGNHINGTLTATSEPVTDVPHKNSGHIQPPSYWVEQ